MTDAPINIISADQIGDCRIRLVFDDQTEQSVDFKPFLAQSCHPAIRAYLDQKLFGTFRVEFGELVWGDYDLCFPMIDLYRNQIDHRQGMGAAA